LFTKEDRRSLKEKHWLFFVQWEFFPRICADWPSRGQLPDSVLVIPLKLKLGSLVEGLYIFFSPLWLGWL